MDSSKNVEQSQLPDSQAKPQSEKQIDIDIAEKLKKKLEDIKNKNKIDVLVI